MAKVIRLLLSACVAVLALGLLSGSALALRSIQISNPGAQRGTGTNVSFEDESGFLRTVCTGLTLSGSGLERIAKSAGARVGTITEGRTRECTAFGFVGATVTVLAEEARPFTMVYNSILGTLPNITGIKTITRNAGFQIVTSGRTCLYEGETGFLFEVVAERGGALLLERGRFLEEGTALKRERSTAECPAVGRLRGTLRFERARTVTLV